MRLAPALHWHLGFIGMLALAAVLLMLAPCPGLPGWRLAADRAGMTGAGARCTAPCWLMAQASGRDALRGMLGCGAGSEGAVSLHAMGWLVRYHAGAARRRGDAAPSITLLALSRRSWGAHAPPRWWAIARRQRQEAGHRRADAPAGNRLGSSFEARLDAVATPCGGTSPNPHSRCVHRLDQFKRVSDGRRTGDRMLTVAWSAAAGRQRDRSAARLGGAGGGAEFVLLARRLSAVAAPSTRRDGGSSSSFRWRRPRVTGSQVSQQRSLALEPAHAASCSIGDGSLSPRWPTPRAAMPTPSATAARPSPSSEPRMQGDAREQVELVAGPAARWRRTSSTRLPAQGARPTAPIMGAEASGALAPPERAAWSPGTFIPLAERHGL